MKIEFCLILFVQLCVTISGTKYVHHYEIVKPTWSEDSEPSPIPQCGRNEVFAECGATCPETCEFLNLACPGQCRPGGGCVCRQGYVRNERQICVPASGYCKPIEMSCGRNEVFSPCAPLCEQQCNIQIKCAAGCEPKCICRDGYIRNSNNKCIRKSQCPPPPETEICFGEHKVYVACGTPLECRRTCDKPEVNSDLCASVKGCAKGCFCEDGYVMDKFGDCVLLEDCPFSNPESCYNKPNEVYLSCGTPQGCVPTCDDPKEDVACPAVCVEGCYCEEGYLRNSSGICVKKQDCPNRNKTCPGVNEQYFSCGSPPACTPTCDDRKIAVTCLAECFKGCYCKDGFLRNSNGVCVAEQDCPVTNTTCSGENEIFSSCGIPQGCLPTCDDPKDGIACAVEGCVQGCYCKEGYIRNSFGKCVKKEDCPTANNTCTGENELYLTCGTPVGCTPTCDDRKIDVLCPALCTKGCYCKGGYLKNSSGVCIPEETCPVVNTTCSKDNEVYLTCGTPEECTPTCEFPNSQIGRTSNVLCASVCTKGCYCKEGYLRDKTGNCIPVESCPQNNNTCVGENKVFTECARPAPCQPTCENPINDNICAAVCVEACVCKEGYLINAKGDCIKEEFCPPPKPCGANQVFDTCGKLASCLPTCENPNNYSTICPEVCVQGCFCIPGYLKNENGECVKEEYCPTTNTCGRNQEFKTCGQPKACLPTCEEPNKIIEVCTDNCVQGCYCKSGYLMNANGDCVREENCPNKCNDPLKVYNSCGTPASCLPTCENPVNNKICPAVCVPGCFCREGYLINKNGKCIRADKCFSGGGSTTCNDPLKEYKVCGKPAGCTATCENPINHKLCPAVCVPGCFCKEGYLMNKDGKCIRSNRCPLPQTCSDPLKQYNSCGKPADCMATCENPVNNKLCPAVCVPGCFCKEGYLMNKAGKCIPSSQCPSGGRPTCADPLKSYRSCGKPAECTATCENPVNNKLCPAVCVPGCFCKKGYLINKDGKCILSTKCPSGGDSTVCNDPLKEYNSCGTPAGCIPTCEDPFNKKLCIDQCNPGCFCKKGYLINKDGKCIKADKCPPKSDPTKCVGPHKIFNMCGLANICLPTCENPQNTRPCPATCTEGCFCEDGYLINQKGECVPEDQCPPQKLCRGDHKYYDSCGKPPGSYPTCEKPLIESTCTERCVEGCYCEDGYLMNKKGECIKADICFAECK